MKRSMITAVCVVAMLTVAVPALQTQAAVSGDPAADGWHLHGNALDNGLYAEALLSKIIAVQ